MSERKATNNNPERPMLNGKRHSVKVQYTNKDAQELLFEFIKRQGPDVSAHEIAVDFFAEHQEFSEGFKVYSQIHVFEDIVKHILNRRRPEPSEQFELPIDIQEYGGLPQYVPYVADNGQLRNIIASEAEWFHLNSWRESENRTFRSRSKRHSNINRIVAFFEPYMKGTKVTVRHICETLKHCKKPN